MHKLHKGVADHHSQLAEHHLTRASHYEALAGEEVDVGDGSGEQYPDGFKAALSGNDFLKYLSEI